MALADTTVLQLSRGYRFQWEQAQNAYVLLFPEGMVKLGSSAGEILKRIDGVAAVADIIADLQRAFPGAELRGDVVHFLEHAEAKGWVHARQP